MSEPMPLSAPEILPGPLALDASTIDGNLRTIRQVESSWRLPQLPDEVRLDLAGNSAIGAENLSRFLYGVERDVFLENEEDLTDDPLQPTAAPQYTVVNGVQPYTPLEQSAFEQASSMISELRGHRPADELDMNAVQRWKMSAIEAGYLAPPEDGRIDGSWSPELNTIQRDMMYDSYDKRYRGDKFGAVPIAGENGVLKTLFEWTSPSGLFRAAVNLDLWWDQGQIGKEFSSWGDKWRKVGDSKNPLDFGKNLFDAMTGPIDDIVVPAFNMALLFSGVGAGTNFARLGLTGLRGATEGVAAFRGATALYKTPVAGGLLQRIFPALDTAEAAVGAARGLSQASWTAKRLQAGGKTASAIGDTMAAWRALPAVVGSKRVVQTGMRLGLASQVENRLLPSYEGKSFGDVESIATAADRALLNPWVTTVGEVLFTPFSAFEPGTFIRGGKDAVAGAFRNLGSVPGRAVTGAVVGAGVGTLGDADAGDVLEGAAMGAGVGAALPVAGRAMRAFGDVKVAGKGVPVLSKAVGHTGDFLARTSYLPLGNDERVTNVFVNAVRRTLPEEQWTSFERGIQRQGFLKTFAEYIGTDEQGAGGAMAFTLLSGAIDHTAAQQAGQAGSKGWRSRYWLARNKLQSQLRVFGPEATKEEVVLAMVSKETHSRRGLRRRFEIMMEAENETELAELIALHNEQANLTLRQLLSPDNLPVEGLDDVAKANLGTVLDGDADARFSAMTDYVGTALDSFGNWGKYAPLTTDLRAHISAGILEDVQLRAPKSSFGKNLKMLEHLDEFSDPMNDQLVNWSQHLHDTMFVDRSISVEQFRKAGGYYNPLARELDPSRARFTLAKVDTLTKQQYIEEASRVQDVLDMAMNWRAVGRVKPPPPGVAGPLEVGLGTLTVTEMSQYLKALGLSSDRGSGKALARLNRLAHQAGLTVDQAFERTLGQYADEIAADPRWTEVYKLEAHTIADDGKILSRFDALKARKKALSEEARFRAADIDPDDLVAKLRAAGKTAEADDFEAYVKHAESQGYKIVYGADFMAPDDLLHRTGMFADINARHLNAMTLGNFFGRKHPEELARNVQRARQLSIARELAKIEGRPLDPDDPLVAQATDDLYKWVFDPELVRNQALTDDLHHQNWIRKRGSAIVNADSVRSIQDLGMGKHRTRVIDALVKVGWTDKQAAAIWQGVKGGRYAEFKDQGLYAIEAKLRGKNQLIGALRVLGGSPEGRKLGWGAALGASTGAVYGQSQLEEGSTPGDERLAKITGGIIGGLVGAGGKRALGVGTDRLVNAIDMTAWARYGYLADNLAAMRDKMRFTLSPFFDISRYTEAFVLNQVATGGRLDDGSRVAIPLNASPKALRRAYARKHEAAGLSPVEARAAAEADFTRVTDEYRQAARGLFDPDSLEATGAWFREIGIMGFNPTAWKSTSFAHFREQGLSAEDAFQRVEQMYHYGTRSRSAAEQSVNFIFFPFSFQKKTVGHAVQFLSDDLTRSVLLHDAYQAYQILDERYDLGQWAEDHLPALEKLQQLNLFAFGISPGRLGGINAPYLDAVVGNPFDRDPGKRGLIFNLFNPVGVNVQGPGAMDVLQQTVKRTIPAINDLHHMIEDTKEQGHVIFGESHMTRRAETTAGYAEWTEFKKGVDEALAANGATMYDLHNDPGLAPLKNLYMEKKVALEKRYPGWVESKLRAAANRAELQQEREYRLNTVAYYPEQASQGDLLFANFESQLEELKLRLEENGITDMLDAPSDVYDRVRGVGVEMARTFPGFEMIWKKFYQSDWGSLTAQVA